MTHRTPLRQGQVYWVDAFPPPDGVAVKRRPVVVVSPPEVLLRGSGTVLVVAVSASNLESSGETDRVPLPNRTQNPAARTGLPRPSWAIPRWLLPTDRERLVDLAGYVSGATLRRILLAVEQWSKRD